MYLSNVHMEMVMSELARTLTPPRRVSVNRSELRSKQREVLKKAKGSTVVVVSASDEGEEKVVLDRQYFDQVFRGLRALRETLEIAMDERLFARLQALARTLDEDVQLGRIRLRSLEEALGEEE